MNADQIRVYLRESAALFLEEFLSQARLTVDDGG
jgi:hypothetical protein